MLKKLFIFFIASSSLAALAQSDSSQTAFLKGMEEKGKGRRQESLRYFEKAYGYNNSDKQIISELASAYFDLHRYGLAKEKYQQLEKMGGGDESLYRQLMNLSFTMRGFDDAVRYANLLKKVAPAEKVSYIIGKSFYETENLGEGIKYLQVAATEDPTKAEIPYTIAHAYSDMSNHKQAIPFFQQAIALDTTNTRWIYEMALVYYAINDDKNSLKYMQLAADKGYKQDNEFLENLAVAYLNAGRAEEGIAKLKEILKRRPTDASILNMIAEGYYEARKWPEAIEYYDQLLAVDKSNFRALYMIGMSFQKKGEKEKGIALCDKAISLDPSLASLKQEKKMTGGAF